MKSLDHAALLALTKKLAQPIDFQDLERRGLISKAGAWYRVHKAVPEHVSRKIRAMTQDAKGLKVKFEEAAKYEKLRDKFQKLSDSEK
jgi:hypothetical protein